MNRATLAQRIVVLTSARARVLERLVAAADAIAVVRVVGAEASASRAPLGHQRHVRVATPKSSGARATAGLSTSSRYPPRRAGRPRRRAESRSADAAAVPDRRCR